MGEQKYTKTILNKKTVKELVRIAVDEEGRDEEAVTTMTKPELIDDLLQIEVSEDEDLEDELDEELDDEELPDEEEDDIEADEPEEVKPAAAKKTRGKAAAKKSDAAEGTTLAAKQVATLLETEAKTLRQFFRSPASTVKAVGSGGRYEFNESDVPQIKEEFEKWKAGHASRGAKRGEGTPRAKGKRGAKVAEVTEVEEVEELEIEELEDDELDDEELELEDED